MERKAAADRLLANIKANMTTLSGLKADVDTYMWGYEDLMYRYYHHSFKVFRIQDQTEKIVTNLKALAPELPLNEKFLRIYNNGTGKKFKMEDNQNWDRETLPMMEAFHHSKYFLDQVVKYGKALEVAPNVLPSGWAAVLHLYKIR